MILIASEKCHILESLFEDFTDTCPFSCFEGNMGKAFADNEDCPQICCIHIGSYLYIDGDCENTNFLEEAFAYAKKYDLNIVTLNEKIIKYAKELFSEKCIFSERYQMGNVLETKDKHLFKNINDLPEEFELAKIDENIYKQSLKNDWSEYFCNNFKNYEDFSKNGLGYAILRQGKIVSATSSYTYYNKGYEVCIATDPDFRRQKLALVSASAFVLECLRTEKFPNWDAANKASLALSQKLGYTLFRTYRSFKVK